MTRKISSRTNMPGRELKARQDDELALSVHVDKQKPDFNAEETLPPD